MSSRNYKLINQSDSQEINVYILLEKVICLFFFPSADEAEISEIKFCPSKQNLCLLKMSDNIFQMLKLFTKKEK